MRTAYAFTRAALQQQLTYRTANWAGLFTNSFFLFFRAYVLEAMYRERSEIGGLSEGDATTYVVVTQAILMVVPQWGVVGVASTVYTGQIATEMLRPVDFYTMHMARRLGVASYYVVMRLFPLLLVGAMSGLLHAPDFASLPWMALSLMLGTWIANSLLFLVELSSFWLESERGVRLVVLGASILPSGLTLPLTWFPEPIEFLFRCTPFPYTLYLPAELWLGTATSASTAIAIQLAWAVGLSVACRVAFSLGTRRLQVVGG